jgi:putative transposase
MIRTFQYKIYPSKTQANTLASWLGTCCWIYNQMLEMRIKAYKRRNESVKYYDQQSLLTKWRARIERVGCVPVCFGRDAIRRLDNGMAAFFRRCEEGSKPGFPRFRSSNRYCSLECLQIGKYLKGGRIRIPNMGEIRCRGMDAPLGVQKGLRIVRRADGWFAHVVIENAADPAENKTPVSLIGVDVGLESFATLSNGEKVGNPRFLSTAARKIRSHQRRVSRRVIGSRRRTKSIECLRRQHEKVAGQRRSFCHQQSTALVRKYDVIAVEKLNIKGMVRSRFGKNILDAAWALFLSQLRYKAECAGTQLIEVDPRYTSQECPKCGRLKPKKLSERIHSCECGLICHRDHAAAQVILTRGLSVIAESNRPWRDSTSGQTRIASRQVGPKKREVRKKSNTIRGGDL